MLQLNFQNILILFFYFDFITKRFQIILYLFWTNGSFYSSFLLAIPLEFSEVYTTQHYHTTLLYMDSTNS